MNPQRYDVPHILGTGGLMRRSSWAEMIRLSESRRLFFVVTLACRPGSSLFFVKLEHSHFPPRSPENALFQMAVADWEGERFLWCWVPVEHRATVVRVVDDCGMRLANGVPHIVSGGGGAESSVAVFPMKTRRVWTLENREDSIVYTPGGDVDIREEERFRIAETLAAKGNHR